MLALDKPTCGMRTCVLSKTSFTKEKQMAEVKSHAPGSFSWVDLATNDEEGAKAFYAGLFGWNATDMPAGEGMTYTMLDKGGKNAAGLFKMGDEMKEQGIPPHWANYVAVASADESQKKAEELGGKAVMPAFDVMDAGRMAVLQDPQGAHISIWEAKAHIGSQQFAQPPCRVEQTAACLVPDPASKSP